MKLLKHSMMGILLTTCLELHAQKAVFDNFCYQGNDACFERIEKNSTDVCNPVLGGFYPDPSVCRRGDDYFLVNSSFSYFPGIPLFHSKNLADWQQIGHVLDRPEQLKLDGLGLSSGVYAPAISYNTQNQTFYVINTVVGGINNFLVKTKDPFKEWSEPIRLPQVKGIDPSLFFDEDGKAYIVTSYLPEKSQWYGHRSIHMYEYDVQADTVIADLGIVVDGGVDVSAKPQWLEGPHIYKVKGIYYLIMAEGGTHAGHREVAFYSNHVKGPYKPCAVNPILSQAGLDELRPDKVINVGHADLIDTPQGDWYAFFLGCRPYQDKLYNTGRETFLLPVEWKNHTPVILEKGKAVPAVVKKPDGDVKGDRKNFFPNGNFKWKDEFDGPVLKQEWCMLRTPRETWYEIRKGKLYLEALERTIRKQENQAFLGRRQQHLVCQASVDMMFTPQSEHDFAGLVLFQNENNLVSIGLTQAKGNTVLVVDNVINGKVSRLYCQPSSHREYTFCLLVDKGKCNLGIRKGRKTEILCHDIDITHLSTHKAKGFVGSFLGMYATSAYEMK